MSTSDHPANPGIRDRDGAALLVAVLASCVACFAVALTQHFSQGRADAVRVVPIALVWAAVALAGGRVARDTLEVPWGWLLGAGLLVRVPLLGSPWLLSDDAWRYLWEGAVLNAGLDPFALAPAEIDGLDDALRARVNHPSVSSIYPPLALLWFRGLDLAGGTPWIAQVAATAADLTALMTLWSLTRDARWPAWVWALHPLPVLESAGSAHLEAPALALCGLGLVAWARRRDDLAWVGLGAAALVKLLPLLVLPALLLAPNRKARRWRGPVILVALTAAFSLPMLGSGPALWDGFGSYASRWSFNGFLWPWVAPWLGAWSRPALVAAAASWVIAVTWTHRDPTASLAAAGAAFVLTSPTMHPWYGLWALWPALALRRWRWAIAASFLLLAYAVLATWDATSASWTEPWWLWWITWPPLLGALMLPDRWSRQVADAQPARLRSTR